MTFPDQLRYWSLVKGPGDEEDYVVDHVAVGDVVHELGQGPSGLVPHVLELRHQLLPQFVLHHGDLNNGDHQTFQTRSDPAKVHLKSAFIRQEVAVVR